MTFGGVELLQGIDSDEPILQLGRNVFSGAYEDTFGTKVLFECNSSTYFSEFLLSLFLTYKLSEAELTQRAHMKMYALSLNLPYDFDRQMLYLKLC